VNDARLARALQHGLMRLAARYLLTTGKGGRPYDPVARFHLGNGARIERLNYLADTSARGRQQSYGLMVNYLYDPDTIEANVEAFSRSGEIAAADRHTSFCPRLRLRSQNFFRSCLEKEQHMKQQRPFKVLGIQQIAIGGPTR
jgi:hypothetical protein